MAHHSDIQQPGRHSRLLLLLTSIYGLLYVAFIATGSYGTTGAEPTVVRLLFLLFLVGYALTWKNEGLGGAIFVLWWAGLWYLGLFVAEQDRGAAVVLGLPLFVLALLFIRAWYRRTHTHSTAP
jgi:hypothetical protein